MFAMLMHTAMREEGKQMDVTIRLSGDLGRAVGVPRLQLSLPDAATVGDLVAGLIAQYPDLRQQFSAAVPVVGGVHATPSTVLTPGREVALLTPIAGGSMTAGRLTVIVRAISST